MDRTLPRLLSLREVAEATGVPRSTWYTMVARGEIPAVHIGRSVRVEDEDVRRWIAANTDRAL